MKRFQGVFTALVTPFDSKGNVDEKKLEILLEDQIKKGISGIVPCGTTGESPTLSHDEHNQVVKLVVEIVNKRVPVIAGSGSNSTKEAVMLTQHAEKSGADASLQVNPYYNKPTQEGLYQHFKTIADNVNIPIVVYNIQGRTAVNVETPTLVRLAEHKNICGVKEASGNIGQMMEVIRQTPDDFCVLSGDDNITYPLMALGGDGVISVVSNIIPDRMEEMIQAALKNDFAKAKELHYNLLDLFKAMFIETNPIPVKTALGMMGIISPDMRLPLVPMAKANKDKLGEILKSYNLI